MAKQKYKYELLITLITGIQVSSELTATPKKISKIQQKILNEIKDKDVTTIYARNEYEPNILINTKHVATVQIKRLPDQLDGSLTQLGE